MTGYSGGEDGEDAAIDLNHYYNVLRAHWRTIGIFTACAALAGILYLHIATQLYTVTLQVTPVVTSNNTLQSSGMASLANAASLAGVTLPGNDGDRQLNLYLAALSSSTVAQTLIDNPQIGPVLFADSWDADSKTWREPSSATRPVKNAIKNVLGFNVQAWHPPAPQDMMDLIAREVAIDYKPTSPIVTIAYKNRDPRFARAFLTALHSAADNELRGRAMRRATAYIVYLENELKTVTSADQRQALVNTMTNQESFRMAAGANISYSVDIFSPPTASAKPTNPQSPIVLLTYSLVGLVLGMAYVLVSKGGRRRS